MVENTNSLEKVETNKVSLDSLPRNAKNFSLFVRAPQMAEKLEEMLGSRAEQFTSSMITLVNNNDKLAKCDPQSMYNSCIMAATLDLPVNANMGLAYFVPYSGKVQLQLGYKAFIQLALRSGQFKIINVTDVKEGEIVKHDRLTGEIVWDWIDDEAERESLKTIGYVCYFELLNGFRKTVYMTSEAMEAHAKKYSQSYRANSTFMNIWRDNFKSMAFKTVIKLSLSKWAPLSVQMQKAIEFDQKADDDYPDKAPKNNFQVEERDVDSIIEGDLSENKL